jgi:DNA-binding MarR family transcriptional regulator
VTQFNVLAVLAQSGAMPLTDLAQILGMERSALARNLKPLERDDLVSITVGEDKRARIATVTSQGKERLQKSLAHWSKVQKRLLEELGEENASHLAGLLRGIVGRLE